MTPPLGAPPSAATDPFRVLLVEDDDGDALLVEDLLEEAGPGTAILRARTCGEALARLELPVDCVLLDLKLPDAMGLETVVRIRARAPDLALIVLTGLDDEAAGTAAVDAGAQDYLVKGSVDGDQLTRAIRYAIARSQVEAAKRELLLSELQTREIARLERGLAPRPLLSESSLWISSLYRAGRDRALLGGDFFDVAEAPDGRVRVVVGDVCGHGPDEAAIGVCLRVAWRALALTGVDSRLVMVALERVLEHERQISDLFTTLCTLEIDPRASSAQMMRAGHPPPLLIDGNEVSRMPWSDGGPPIGMAEGQWSLAPITLPAQWTILLYTDGITEARIDGGSQRLGEEGLMWLVSDYIASHPRWREQPDRLLSKLIASGQELNGGELTDDVAMLLVGASPRTPEQR